MPAAGGHAGGCARPLHEVSVNAASDYTSYTSDEDDEERKQEKKLLVE